MLKGKELLNSQLKELGIQYGDNLFIVSDFIRLGYFRDNGFTSVLDVLYTILEIIGPDGNIIVPSYSKTVFLWDFKNIPIFNINSEPKNNALATAIFNLSKHSNYKIVRSNHPTNSYIAIGPNAEEFVGWHNYKNSSYEVMVNLYNRGFKNLLLGMAEDEFKSLSVLHAAQEKLKLSYKHYLSGKLKAYYYNDGELKLYRRKSIGGCTRGGKKAIGYLLSINKMSIGLVGRSRSILIDWDYAFDFHYDRLKEDRSYFRCHNSKCKDCYGSPAYNLGFLFFWIKKLLKL